MTEAREINSRDVYTKIHRDTQLIKRCVISRAFMFYPLSDGTPADKVLWSVVYKACRHYQLMTHEEFFRKSLMIEDGIAHDDWNRLLCPFQCPLTIELLVAPAGDPRRIDI